MNTIKFVFLSFLFLSSLQAQNKKTGNVIFIHPDGTGLADWHATRILYYGPDGELNWDKLPNVAVYKSHMLNSISASSHAGATIHSYGIKVPQDSYGMKGKDVLVSRSGKKQSIMQEAVSAGIKCGIINSGNIVEPGTGVFVASSPSRYLYDEITEKIIKSGADIIFSGGEEYMLPEGEQGFHGKGKRKDDLNLIKWARENGYEIIYTKDQLKKLSDDVEKVLGVFALDHTFNDKTEEELVKLGLKNYSAGAPTVAEMTDKAMKIFSRSGKQFFLVTEEEGTDNFGNQNNANGKIEALKNADDAIGVVLEFIKNNPNTLLITAADSEAGGMELIGMDNLEPAKILAEYERNGAPVDGKTGKGSIPFLSAPDKYGKQLPFYIAWSTGQDSYGSVVSRATGLNSELLHGTIDNTEIYRIMYATLFGIYLE